MRVKGTWMILFSRGTGAAVIPFPWQLGQLPVQLIQGIAKVGVKLQQVGTLTARMI